jgi:hypothetical protein
MLGLLALISAVGILVGVLAGTSVASAGGLLTLAGIDAFLGIVLIVAYYRLRAYGVSDAVCISVPLRSTHKERCPRIETVREPRPARRRAIRNRSSQQPSHASLG